MLAQAQVQEQMCLASQGELACSLYTLQHFSMEQVYLTAYASKNYNCQFTYDNFAY